VIRPAVEAALTVARAGLTADPVVLPPHALRPYLSFAKQTPRSLEAIARVVERDDEFRARVADVVDEQQVGRAGWLWLTRPEGWRGELERLEAASAARFADEQEARAERTATRKLAAAQAAALRAESEAAARLAELDEVRAELLSERARRAAAEARATELDVLVAQLTAARAAVVKNLKEVEARLVDRSTEVNAIRARVRALENEARDRRAEADRAIPAGGSPVGEPAPPSPALDPGHRHGHGHADADAVEVPAADEAGRTVPADRAELLGEIARAARGAAALADGLAALARLLGPGEPTVEASPEAPRAPSDRSDSPAVPASVNGGPSSEEARSRERRVPISLPGGVFDDSVEAAEHLLRAPGAVLVVDGYNVTMSGWPDLGASDQRRRLVAALSDLAARTSTQVELVFDGAEVSPVPVPSPTRQLVRVRFSSPGVEADDVVIDLVERIPAATPVIVASSDNRVREGVRRSGANLLHARQLLAVLRR
jgi:predicted RNA-binding protein with PIN domain